MALVAVVVQGEYVHTLVRLKDHEKKEKKESKGKRKGADKDWAKNSRLSCQTRLKVTAHYAAQEYDIHVWAV